MDIKSVQDVEAVSVWLIEDDRTYRETVERVLASAPGVQCDRACETAEEALEALESSFAPEVILIDLGLPGISGVEALAKIRSRSPETKLIVLTVFQDDEKIFNAICGGASGYLLKPSSRDRIVEAIRSVRAGGTPINPYIASRVLEMFTRFAVPHEDYRLTSRETEILGLLVDERTKREIAEGLFLSYHTVDMHIRNIYSKLHVHSKSGAVAKALKERLI